MQSLFTLPLRRFYCHCTHFNHVNETSQNNNLSRKTTKDGRLLFFFSCNCCTSSQYKYWWSCQVEYLQIHIRDTAQFPADFVTFSEKILNGKIHFLWSETIAISIEKLYSFNENPPKFYKDDCRNLPLEEAFFTFNNKYYWWCSYGIFISP